MTTDRVALATLIAAGALFAGVLARVAQLQHAPGDELRAHLSDRARDASVAAPRGAVYDRRDRLLASSDTRRRLFLDPLRFPRDDARAVRAVAAAAGLDASLIEETVSAAHAENDRREGTDKLLIRYRAIGGLLPDHAADAVAELPVPGVHLERRPVRESGAPESLAPVIGKVAFDHSGLLGLERALETDLAPRAGRASVIRDADGDPLWIEGDRLTPAARGRDVTLSVDARLQRLAERALAEGLEAADAAAGRLIAIDPRTGEILAMLDRYRETEAVPFDPELVPEDADDDWPRFDVVPPDPVREKEPALARVRCAQDAYEPGSTFKPIIWSAVLERRAATLDETLDTHGGAWRTDYGRLLRDVVERDSQTVFDVLVNSSNIGMAKLAARLEDQHLQSAIRKFGFGAPTGLRLPREESGIVTPPERWNKYTSTSVAFGYEIAVTPAQMVRAFAAFARVGDRAGTLPRLTLLMQKNRPEPILHRVIPAPVAAAAREAMREVARLMVERNRRVGRLTEGVPAYELFGKSGTALLTRPDGRGYFTEQYVSSFVAAAPAQSPRVAVLVVIDDPGPNRVANRSHYGSAVAGPVAARFLHDALEYLAVPHDRPNRNTINAPDDEQNGRREFAE